ncbi:MAG TPA: hypothetical protein VMD30_05565 [Tepidisphaeraceae bacterium]|nr:hypothetical protein [Tepidisphaeraceae bacterium]
MGLDGVELLIDMEHEFGISIPDDAASKVATVQDAANLIVEILRTKQWPVGVCSTAHSFYALRRQLVARFDASRGDVRLDTPIGKFIPRGCGIAWSQVAAICDLRNEFAVFAKNRVPPPAMPIRQLIETRSQIKWLRIDGTVDQTMVLERVRQMSAEQMGIPIGRVKPESHFIEDLGMG